MEAELLKEQFGPDRCIQSASLEDLPDKVVSSFGRCAAGSESRLSVAAVSAEVDCADDPRGKRTPMPAA
jgi:hypothetical protein